MLIIKSTKEILYLLHPSKSVEYVCIGVSAETIMDTMAQWLAKLRNSEAMPMNARSQ